MKIVVLVKSVPDTESKIKITADGSGIETQGLKFVMNPYDEYAVEEAIRIRERLKDDTTVVAISLGPDRVVEVLRTALAMGADDAGLVRPLLVATALQIILVYLDCLIFAAAVIVCKVDRDTHEELDFDF